MNYILENTHLGGNVRVPASKSVVHRLFFACALADLPTSIPLPVFSDDLRASMNVLYSLGADFDPFGEDALVISPVKKKSKGERLLYCQGSGTTARFALPVAAALYASFSLITDSALALRPFVPLIKALSENGVAVEKNDNVLSAKGKLTPGRFMIDGSVSSQYVSGFLFALPLLKGDSEIIFSSPLVSVPYVNLTISVLEKFGVGIGLSSSGYTVKGRQKYRSPGFANAEGDWSAAAFWLVANALGSHIEISGLDEKSVQGDRAVTEHIKRFSEPGELVTIPVSDTPDLVPPLAVLAAAVPKKTILAGTGRLSGKESDRASALCKMLNSLGGKTEQTQDSLIITGGLPLHGGDVSSMGDHRIAMAAAVLSGICSSPLILHGAEAVTKSYPEFWEDFRNLGGKVKKQ